MHLYVVVGGRYKTAAANLATEQWQTGYRFVATGDPSPPSIGDLPSDNEVYPVPANHNRDETGWTIVGNWSLEMGVNDLDPADWLNDQLAPAWVTFFGTARFSSTAWVETIKVYPIDDTGHVAPAPPFSTGTPVTLTMKAQTTCDGGGGTGILPPQISVVASLRTDQVGPSSRGRMFLPAIPSGDIANYGQYGESNNASMAGYVAAMLESSQVTDPMCLPAVIPGNWSTYSLIKGVRVGSVFDTQRRRRNQLPEAFASVAVANPDI